MPGCGDFLSEFRLEKFGFSYEDPSALVKSQWTVSQKVYVVYRIVVGVGLTAWTVSDLMSESETFYSDRPWQWFIFATNWSFTLLALSALYQAVAAVCYTSLLPNSVGDNYTPWTPVWMKIGWLLHVLAANSAIVVTLSYWCFITFLDHSPFLSTTMSEMKHTMNTIYVVIDLFISAQPVRILHFVYPIVLGVVYAVFNALYFLLINGTVVGGRHYTYSVLDWANPSEAFITCMVATLETILSQLVLYSLFRLRIGLYNKIYFHDGQQTDTWSGNSELQSIITPTKPAYKSVDDAPDEE